MNKRIQKKINKLLSNTSWVDWMQNNKHSTTNCHAMLLKNGVSLSIQASNFHYCQPRRDGDYSIYTEFEIGFPTERIEDIMYYAEDYHNPLDTVYAYVPKDIITKYINRSGGIVGEGYPNNGKVKVKGKGSKNSYVIVNKSKKRGW